jgi:hypothetical protein
MGLFDQQQMTKPDIRIDSGYQPQVGQGLMGLGQQPQQGQPQYTSPMNQNQRQYIENPSDVARFAGWQNYANQGGTQGWNDWSSQNYNQFEPQNDMLPPMQQPQYTSPMNQPQGNMPPMPQGNMPQIGQPLGRFIPATGLSDGIINSEGGSYEYPQQPQRIPSQSFFEGPNAGRVPQGFQMVNGELVNMGFNDDSGRKPFTEGLSTTPALRPTPQPPQIFQPQPMQQPMQQQPSNPVNTQTVQPNFLGQTPFGQAQTSQFTSTNPFVQAAQANAQGNIAGALQATAANRINQQTPYGSLSYQQTGTDAQGNPIWSANQNLSPELQQLTQSSLAGLQASQANPMYGINPGDTYSNAIMQRLAPQQSQAREALDAQLANQGIMPGSEAYNRAKTLLGQTQNDALTSAIVGGMQTGLQAQGLQNTTAANIRNLSTPGYVTPYNQAAVAGPDYLSAYTSQNATEIARQNAEAAQRSAMLGGLAGLGSSAILGGTGPNSALGGLYNLGSKGLEALGNTSLWNSLFGGGGSAITGDKDFLKSIGLDNSFYGSGTGGMLTDPLADLYTNGLSPDQNLSNLFNSSFGFAD